MLIGSAPSTPAFSQYQEFALVNLLSGLSSKHGSIQPMSIEITCGFFQQTSCLRKPPLPKRARTRHADKMNGAHATIARAVHTVAELVRDDNSRGCVCYSAAMTRSCLVDAGHIGRASKTDNLLNGKRDGLRPRSSVVHAFPNSRRTHFI